MEHFPFGIIRNVDCRTIAEPLINECLHIITEVEPLFAKDKGLYDLLKEKRRTVSKDIIFGTIRKDMVIVSRAVSLVCQLLMDLYGNISYESDAECHTKSCMQIIDRLGQYRDLLSVAKPFKMDKNLISSMKREVVTLGSFFRGMNREGAQYNLRNLISLYKYNLSIRFYDICDLMVNKPIFTWL